MRATLRYWARVGELAVQIRRSWGGNGRFATTIEMDWQTQNELPAPFSGTRSVLHMGQRTYICSERPCHHYSPIHLSSRPRAPCFIIVGLPLTHCMSTFCSITNLDYRHFKSEANHVPEHLWIYVHSQRLRETKL